MKYTKTYSLSVALNILFITILTIIGVTYFISIKPVKYGQTISTDKTTKFKWPEGKKMALCLTFDDACLSQIDNGIPVLDKYGIKATFYVSLGNLKKRLPNWKKAISSGHEIGNHTRKHPCTVNFEFSKGNALEDYTIQMMRMELYSENEVIKELLDVRPVSFAYPCGQTFIGRGINTQSYVPLISELFESGRTTFNGCSNNPVFCDMSQLNGYNIDGLPFDQIKSIIETAKKDQNWLILLGHEIPNEIDNQSSQLSTIESICKYASDPANGIWITTAHQIAAYIKEKRGETQFIQSDISVTPLDFVYYKLWAKYYVYKNKL